MAMRLVFPVIAHVDADLPISNQALSLATRMMTMCKCAGAEKETNPGCQCEIW